MTEPSTGTPGTQPDDETSVDPVTGPEPTPHPASDDEAARHAAARPAPVPPGPAPAESGSAAATATPAWLTPAAGSDGAGTPGADATDIAGASADAPGTDAAESGTASAPTAGADGPGAGPGLGHPRAAAPLPTGAPAPVPPTGEPGFDFPDPHPPAPAGIWAHVLGVLVGLVLAPVGALALLLGQSRILVVQADGWDGDVEMLGIALVAVGAVLLACVVLLATWTAAVPVTGGVVLLLLGLPALVAPTFTARQTLLLIDPEGWHATVTQTVVAGTSGTLLLAGLLLLVAGLAAAATRRRGLRLGAFRERHRVG